MTILCRSQTICNGKQHIPAYKKENLDLKWWFKLVKRSTNRINSPIYTHTLSLRVYLPFSFLQFVRARATTTKKIERKPKRLSLSLIEICLLFFFFSYFSCWLTTHRRGRRRKRDGFREISLFFFFCCLRCSCSYCRPFLNHPSVRLKICCCSSSSLCLLTWIYSSLTTITTRIDRYRICFLELLLLLLQTQYKTTASDINESNRIEDREQKQNKNKTRFRNDCALLDFSYLFFFVIQAEFLERLLSL